MTTLKLDHIVKRYGEATIIPDLSLDIASGEFIVLVGPAGCGKSTLLRAIAGLDDVQGGTVLIDGEDMTKAPPVARGIAMVFQSYALYPHMTVAQNIGFGMRIAGESKQVMKARVAEVADLLKLSPLLSRKPRALSGGQRQRVAIGRALARKPKIFLFDEPLSNLDAALRAEMRVELARLHARLGNTMVYVTHDQVEAMTLATRMVIMNNGVIEQAGTPLELFNHPRNIFVAGFLGHPKINLLKARANSGHGSTLNISLPGLPPFHFSMASEKICNDQEVTIGIRPENVSLSAVSEHALPVVVDVVEHLGTETIIHGKTDDGQMLVARLPGQADAVQGAQLLLKLSKKHLHVFDSNGHALSLHHG